MCDEDDLHIYKRGGTVGVERPKGAFLTSILRLKLGEFLRACRFDKLSKLYTLKFIYFRQITSLSSKKNLLKNE